MPWWKPLNCVLGKCTECGDSAGQCLTWLIWNGLWINGDIAGASSAFCLLGCVSFNILCLVQSALFQGKVLFLWVSFWQHCELKSQDWGTEREAQNLFLPHPAGMQFSCLPHKDDIYAPTSQLMDYCLKWQTFWLFSWDTLWAESSQAGSHPPVPWFITAVNLHTRSQIKLGNSLAESTTQLKEKLFG